MVNNCRALSALELSGVARVRASSRTVWSPVAGSSPIWPNAARRRAGEMLLSTARFTMLGSKYALCMRNRSRRWPGHLTRAHYLKYGPSNGAGGLESPNQLGRKSRLALLYFAAVSFLLP